MCIYLCVFNLYYMSWFFLTSRYECNIRWPIFFFGSEIFEKLMKIYDLGQGRCKSRFKEAAATFGGW